MTAASFSLISRLRAGEASAFAAIYREESPIVHGYLLRLTRRHDVAADLFQNVWLKLVAHAPTLSPDTRIRAWLLTVAHNEARSFQRWCRWDVSRALLLTRATTSAAVSVPEELIDVQRALDRLDAGDRETLLLAAVSELTVEDLCKIVGISPTAWRKRLSRARARFDVHLNQSPMGNLERTHS